MYSFFSFVNKFQRSYCEHLIRKFQNEQEITFNSVVRLVTRRVALIRKKKTTNGIKNKYAFSDQYS